MFVGSQKFCTVAHRRPAFQLLKSFPPVLIDQLPQTKPNTLPNVKPIATPIQHLNNFSDKTAEFIHLNAEAGFTHGWSNF
ncbi:MAG: hypothetical protein ACO3TE_16255 [bacterium]